MKIISVLIPAKNEERHVEKCLRSLINQTLERHRYEIIFADNMSTDNTFNLAKKYADIAFQSDAKKIGQLRNELADRAAGNIYIYIDADCTAEDDYLESIHTYFDNNPDIAVIGGYIRAPLEPPFLVKGWALPKEEHITNTNIAATGSMAIRSSCFKKIGGFNQNISAGEDTEFSARTIKNGFRIVLHPKASVVHHGFPSATSSFLARQFWQTKDYIRTRKRGIDLIFLATATYLFLFIPVIIGLTITEQKLVLLSATLQCLIIASITTLKIVKIPKKKLNYVIPVIYTTTLYLLARSAGLAHSLARETIAMWTKKPIRITNRK